LNGLLDPNLLPMPAEKTPEMILFVGKKADSEEYSRNCEEFHTRGEKTASACEE